MKGKVRHTKDSKLYTTISFSAKADNVPVSNASKIYTF